MKTYLKLRAFVVTAAAFAALNPGAGAAQDIVQTIKFEVVAVSQNTNKLAKIHPGDTNVIQEVTTTPMDNAFIISNLSLATGISFNSRLDKLVRVITESNTPVITTNLVVVQTNEFGFTNFIVSLNGAPRALFVFSGGPGINGVNVGEIPEFLGIGFPIQSVDAAASFAAAQEYTNTGGESVTNLGETNSITGYPGMPGLDDEISFTQPSFVAPAGVATTVIPAVWTISSNAVPAGALTTNANLGPFLAEDRTNNLYPGTAELGVLSSTQVSSVKSAPFFHIQVRDSENQVLADVGQFFTFNPVLVVNGYTSTTNGFFTGSTTELLTVGFGAAGNGLNTSNSPSFTVTGVATITWAHATKGAGVTAAEAAAAEADSSITLEDATGSGLTANGSPSIVTGSISFSGGKLVSE